MNASSLPKAAPQAGAMEALRQAWQATRALSLALAAPLTAEDLTAQAHEDCSPGKWHLAHTSWFLDRLILRPLGLSPAPVGAYDAVFNSYYVSLGARERRDGRGLLTRPGLAQVLAYRAEVDARILALLETEREESREALALIELAIHHEQQHQELFLADILALFALNPLRPAYLPIPAPTTIPAPARAQTRFVRHDGGLLEIGAFADGFSYDCERPRHRVFLEAFALADQPVSNIEWAGFIADGGYENPLLWLSDGWAKREAAGWRAPAYWLDDGREMTLFGAVARDPNAPVRHISYYEADAFARWAGKRLPIEAEMEIALPVDPQTGFSGLNDLAHSQALWHWTSSAFAPYPGFRPEAGPAAEYNGKFMINQLVLRGGCFASPRGHLRASYRNFYYPHQRWMFSGLRLAETCR